MGSAGTVKGLSTMGRTRPKERDPYFDGKAVRTVTFSPAKDVTTPGKLPASDRISTFRADNCVDATTDSCGSFSLSTSSPRFRAYMSGYRKPRHPNFPSRMWLHSIHCRHRL